MGIAATITAGLATRTAPAKDRPGRPAPHIEAVLAVLSILVGYGRHIAQTLDQRAVRGGFATIARFFGTVAYDTILAHIQRGLMRAIALERLLSGRASRGRDLRIRVPRAATSSEQPAQDPTGAEPNAGSAAPEPLTPEQAAAAEATALKAGERLARSIARNQPLTFRTIPSMEAIEAEVRRSPVGRTLAAICRDFGISPMLCDGAFWNQLFDAIDLHRGSASGLVVEMKRQEKRFDKEEWKHPGLDLAEETRAGVRRVLGFFIGEDPVDPFTVKPRPGAGIAAVATGPP